jgi:hypothetical protein
MPSPDQPDLEALVVVSARVLQQVPSRSSPPRVAGELARLNGVVRDAARPRLTAFDQPADFAATLLRNADHDA